MPQRVSSKKRPFQLLGGIYLAPLRHDDSETVVRTVVGNRGFSRERDCDFFVVFHDIPHSVIGMIAR